MSECTHDCSSCASKGDCKEQGIQKEKLNALSKVGKVFAVVSGKGGVGKSLTTALLAVEAERLGLKTAILDADILGPSIPKMFGVNGARAESSDLGIFPVMTKKGISVMSVNLLLENETDPVVWRGPVLAGVVKQFWSDVVWGDIDVMFIDCPPGTGDVPLTVFQSVPVDGIIVVATPQDLVSMIVEKAVKMAEILKIPVIGAVENMAYFICDKCGQKHYVFGKGNMEQIAKAKGIDAFCQVPFSKEVANQCDRGLIELTECDALTEFASKLL
ncbi:MAG: Mrp/NBP35 family ATP-binding protein [Clostridia bacterium]|nr:Mrp/NBP35 family ATP-binding protein [Clostridia bacterium]